MFASETHARPGGILDREVVARAQEVMKMRNDATDVAMGVLRHDPGMRQALE